MDHTPNRKTANPRADAPPTPLEYAPQPAPPRWRSWISRFIARLSRPMPLGMYYLITIALSIIATILAVGIRLLVRAFE